MGIFGTAHGWGVGKESSLPKICHTYPTMMKLGTVIPYLKKIQKIYESRDTPPDFGWHQHFDVITSVDDVTSKILSRDSNYIADVFM